VFWTIDGNTYNYLIHSYSIATAMQAIAWSRLRNQQNTLSGLVIPSPTCIIVTVVEHPSV